MLPATVVDSIVLGYFNPCLTNLIKPSCDNLSNPKTGLIIRIGPVEDPRRLRMTIGRRDAVGALPIGTPPAPAGLICRGVLYLARRDAPIE